MKNKKPAKGERGARFTAVVILYKVTCLIGYLGPLERTGTRRRIEQLMACYHLWSVCWKWQCGTDMENITVYLRRAWAPTQISFAFYWRRMSWGDKASWRRQLTWASRLSHRRDDVFCIVHKNCCGFRTAMGHKGNSWSCGRTFSLRRICKGV